eukprot:JP448398.1.p3 GENE.JP448398.1~~JP448398.1.p3  ORF type:complete len:70 (+),score=22.82 JP448398.1:46-255(+)
MTLVQSVQSLAPQIAPSAPIPQKQQVNLHQVFPRADRPAMAAAAAQAGSNAPDPTVSLAHDLRKTCNVM